MGKRSCVLLFAVYICLVCCFTAPSGEWNVEAFTTNSFFSRRDTIAASETALIDLIDHTDLSDTDKQRAVKGKRRQLDALVERLKKDELKLASLVNVREKIQEEDFFWFFDPDKQLAVDTAQLQVNKQHRACENTLDEIHVLVKEIKPYYGAFSDLCAWDLAYSFFKAFEAVKDFIEAEADFSVFAFLVFTPMLFFFIAFIWSFGIRSLLIVFQVYLLSWLVKAPAIIIQYRPNAGEFTGIYAACVGITLLSWYLISRWLGESMTQKRKLL